MQRVTATEVKLFKRSMHFFCFGYTLLRPLAVSARECVGHAREAHKLNIVLNRTYERMKNRKENRSRDYKLVVRRINCLTGKVSRAVADVRSQTPSQGPILQHQGPVWRQCWRQRLRGNTRESRSHGNMFFITRQEDIARSMLIILSFPV